MMARLRELLHDDTTRAPSGIWLALVILAVELLAAWQWSH